MKSTSLPKRLTVLIALGIVSIVCVLLINKTPPAPVPGQQAVGQEIIQQDSFSGIIVDYDRGEPIEGATISWVKFAGLEKNQHYGETVRETTTDESGAFTLDGVEDPTCATKQIENHMIHLKAPGHESALYGGTSEASTDSLIIPLQKGHSISGKVIISSGEPVENALVGDLLFYRLSNQKQDNKSVILYPSCWTFTDQEGNFKLEGIREGITPFLRVVADGYIPTFSEEINPSVDQDVTITLEEGGAALQGTVLDHDGTPMAECQVILRSNRKYENSPSGNRPHSEPFPIKTDEQGKFSLRNLDLDKYAIQIMFFNKSKIFCRSFENFSLTFKKNGTVSHEFRFSPPTEVSGKIINGETSQGIKGVTVSNSSAKDTQTDENGIFTLQIYNNKLNFSPNRIAYTIPFDFEDQSGTPDRGSYQLTEDDLEKMEGIRIELFPSSKPYQLVKLRAGKPDGQPLTNTTINIGKQVEGTASFKGYTTDDKGVFSASLLPNSTYFVKTSQTSFRSLNSPSGYYGEISFDQVPTEQTVLLKPIYPVKGRIVSEHGDPIPNFGIKLISESDQVSNQGLSATTNEKGEFIFRQVMPGQATLTEGNDWDTLKLDYSTTIEADKLTDLGDLIVPVGKSIALQLIIPEGAKLSSYKIQCFHGEQELKFHRTYKDRGNIVLNGFKEVVGPIKIIVSATNFEPVIFENVALGTTDLKVNLISVPTYSLRVVDQDTGEDIEFINHKLEKYHDRMKQYMFTSYSSSAEESPICLGVLEPGKYRVLAAGMTKGEDYLHDKEFDSRIGYTYFTVEEGDPVKEIVVPISANYGVEVKGSVLLTNGFGTPTDGKVYLNKSQAFQPSRSRSKSPFKEKETTIDSNGCFAFQQVLPGNYYLHFAQDGYIQKEKVKVIVEENSVQKPQEILVYTTGKFKGRITGLDIRSSLSLLLRNADNHNQYSQSYIGKTGNFVFENPFPGGNILSCSSGAHPSLIYDTVTITPGETVERTYDLSDTVLISSKLKIDGKQLKFNCKKDDLDNLYTQVDNPHNNPYPEGFEPPADKYLVPPGQYMLVYQGQMNYRSPIEFITIPGAEQEYNLEMDITSIPVNITFDCEHPFGSSNGDVSLKFSGTTVDKDLFEGDIVLYRSKPLTVKFFKPGTYTFSGKLNYKYKIDSGPIEITKGENNISLELIELTPEEKQKQKEEMRKRHGILNR